MGDRVNGQVEAIGNSEMTTSRGTMIVRMAVVLLVIGLSLLPSSTRRRSVEHGSPGAPAPLASFSKTLRIIADKFPGDRSDRPLSFPFDHGAHPEVPTEIWEFAGQMHTAEGPRYGFLLSVMRLGLQPQEPERPSAWATRDAYRGLFAFLDAGNDHYRASERFARAALRMSGYDPTSGRLWLDGWTIWVAQEKTFSFELRAEAEGMRLNLRMDARKPAVIPTAGDFPTAAGGRLRGYILSRLAISGTVRHGKHERSVSGDAWLNRSWGKMAPPGGQIALNRYQVQLDDGREILIFQLRRKDGSAPPISNGLLIRADGRASPIPENDIKLEPDTFWPSPSGTRYPVAWIMKLPALGIELRLSPLVENQEIGGSARTWSGSISVSGAGPRGERLEGQGFVELTGY